MQLMELEFPQLMMHNWSYPVSTVWQSSTALLLRQPRRRQQCMTNLRCSPNFQSTA
jgi:hypothetical protein